MAPIRRSGRIYTSSKRDDSRTSAAKAASEPEVGEAHKEMIDAFTLLSTVPNLKMATAVARRPSASLARRPSATPSLLSNHSMQAPTKPSTAERNIDNVVFGDIMFQAWYPSPYVKDIVGKDVIEEVRKKGPDGKPIVAELMLERLYVCQWCFGYCRDLFDAIGHRKFCERSPAKGGDIPGRLIYTHPPPRTAAGRAEGSVWSVWEVDGEVDTLYCQCLSLFAKLFLDNKSVFFDVTNFHYYLLVHTSHTTPPEPARPQVVGFFSKEKMSWDNNNLACILIFPPWQRKSLGLLLIAVSYEISRREEILGGPEKPISDLGKKGYLQYWTREIARFLLAVKLKEKDVHKGMIISLDEVSKATWIALDDCVFALREMGVITTLQNKASVGGVKVRVDKEAIRKWAEQKSITLEPIIASNGFLEVFASRRPPLSDDIEDGDG